MFTTKVLVWFVLFLSMIISLKVFPDDYGFSSDAVIGSNTSPTIEWYGKSKNSETIGINEIMYYPGHDLGESQDYQWIELYNFGQKPINLDGFLLNNVKISGIISPNDFFIVARQDSSDIDKNGEFFSKFYNLTNGYKINCPVFDANGMDLNLNLSGGTITLLNKTGDLICRQEYKATSGGDGTGSSLEKILAFLKGNPEYLLPSLPCSGYGTPGKINSNCAVSIEIQFPIGNRFYTGCMSRLRIIYRNKTSIPLSLYSWNSILFPDNNGTFSNAQHSIIIPPLEEFAFLREFLIPLNAPLGEYNYREIVGTQSISFGPEETEFTVSTQTLPYFIASHAEPGR